MARKTVRAPLFLLAIGILFIALSAFEFVLFLDESDVSKRNSDIIFGVMMLVGGIIGVLTYFTVKYEYDENGFTFTSVFGMKKDVLYSDIFNVFKDGRASLRIELKDGSGYTLYLSSKGAKEFAELIEREYIANSISNQLYQKG